MRLSTGLFMEKSFEKLNKQKIDQEDTKPFKEKEPEEEKKLPNELEEYQKQGQDTIDSYHKFFMTYAEDVSLRFKMSNGFYIDLENGEVNLDTKWFAEKDFSKDQILWANLHELSHFRDLAGDPERMMNNFEYIKKQARKTGALIMKEWEDKYGTSDPEFIENLKKQRPINEKDQSKTMNAVEGIAYQIHHTFYNIFDDIYVNNLLSNKAPKYEKEEKGGKEVKKLYDEKLFAKTDYSDLPRHLQFLYKFIREEMVPDKKVGISDEVANIMVQKIKFQGKEYTPREIIEEFIKPKGKRDTRAGQRYFVLQKTLEPIFEKLLIKDLEEWEPEKPSTQPSGSSHGPEGEPGKPPQEPTEPQQGPGGVPGKPKGPGINPFEEDYEEYKKNNPDQIDPEDIEDWVGKYKKNKEEKEKQKAKEKKEENKSAEEKAKEAQEKMDGEWRKNHNIDKKIFRQYRKIEQEIMPYLEDLSGLWQKIIFGSSKKIERDMEGYFKFGTELDIQKTIEQWPEIEKKEMEKIRVFKKMTQKEILVRKPELIRVRLVGDMSGSMDSKKIHILQQCFVLLLSSLREFNTHLNLTRSETKSKLEVDTEVWIFGDKAERIKRLRSESGYEDEQVEMIEIFKHLQQTMGGTYDNKALESISDSLTLEDKEKIKEKKIMEIIFEITDGGSSSPEASKNKVDELTKNGVIVRAFQVGNVDEDEKEIFNDVWNKNHEEKLGEIIGRKIENLLPAITELLKNYLSNVRL